MRVPWTARNLDYSILKGNQPWIFTRKTNAEAEAPILWPPDAKGQLTGKDPDPRTDWRQKEKGVTEDEMLDSITDSVDVSLTKLWETVKDTEAWHAMVHRVTESRTWLSNWTTTKKKGSLKKYFSKV